MDWLIFDFETLHNVPWNATIISLACIGGKWSEITFDKIEQYGLDNILNRGMEMFFDIKTQKTNYERVVSDETVNWWKQQSEEARNRVFHNTHKKYDLEELVTKFTEYCQENGVNKDTKVFLRGPDFDHTIMLSIFKHFDKPLPYNHWNLRDIRTVLDVICGNSYIYKFNDYCNKKYNLIAHDALHDCVRDILQVSYALQHDSSVLAEDYKKHNLYLKGW